MKFTSANVVSGVDYSQYEIAEIRAAVEMATGFTMIGAMINSQRARELGEAIRTKGLASEAVTYINKVGHLTVRVVSPLNVTTMLSEKFKSYECTNVALTVEGVKIPIVSGFVNYKDFHRPLTQLLPGVKIVPFDAAFALNVVNVAAITKYAADKGHGKVVQVTPPTALYDGAPYNGAAMALSFSPDLAGALSLAGMDWAHWLYMRFYDDRKLFMETVATYVTLPSSLLTKDPPQWTKTYSPLSWTADRPKNDVQRLECLSRMQVYRSKDNAGISALTYAIYGQEFGHTYRMAEKMGNFEIFLKTLTDDHRQYPIRYVSKDEKELVSAQLLMRKYGFTLKHFYPRSLNDVKPSTKGYHVHVGEIVYHPKCVTAPFSGKLKEENVEQYTAANAVKVIDRISKYDDAEILGFRAHVLGLESHVIGMATPHNAVGVMIYDAGAFTQAAIWTTIMVAGFARNTYLYHRKDLQYFLARLDVVNAVRREKGEATSKYMAWTPLNRPEWYAFTKEQRKKMLSLLRESEAFGEVPEDISDIDLAALVTRAQENPGMMKVLSQSQSQTKRQEAELFNVTQGTVSSPSPKPRLEQQMVGDDLGAEDDPPEQVRPKLVIPSKGNRRERKGKEKRQIKVEGEEILIPMNYTFPQLDLTEDDLSATATELERQDELALKLGIEMSKGLGVGPGGLRVEEKKT